MNPNNKTTKPSLSIIKNDFKTEPDNDVSSEWDHHNMPPIVYDSLLLPSSVDDDSKFTMLSMLRGILSLNKAEKYRVIHAMPTLSAFQVFALINTWGEETEKWQTLLYKDARKNDNFSVTNDIHTLFSVANKDWEEIVQELQKNLLKKIN